MKIVFKHGKKKPEVTLDERVAFVKLYAVPKTYSPDGYAVAAWAANEIEPAPASAGVETTLLYSGKVERQGEAAPEIVADMAGNVTASVEG